MSNGTSDSGNIGYDVAYQLGPHFERLEGLLTAIQGTLTALIAAQQMNNNMLETIGMMEAARARAAIGEAEAGVSTVSSLLEETEGLRKRERGVIQGDYDSSQSDVIGSFIRTIRTNTQPVDLLKAEYAYLFELEGALKEDLGKLQYAHSQPYDRRRSSLIALKGHTLRSLDEFLEARKQTAEEIESLQTGIPLSSGPSERPEPACLLVPMWVVGYTLGGKEHVAVLPVARRTAAGTAPTRAQPYAHHLVPLAGSLDAYARACQETGSLEIARRASVLERKSEILARMDFLAKRGFVDGTTFFDAIRRFGKETIGGASA